VKWSIATVRAEADVKLTLEIAVSWAGILRPERCCDVPAAGPARAQCAM